jgi:hypothetical protein
MITIGELDIPVLIALSSIKIDDWTKSKNGTGKFFKAKCKMYRGCDVIERRSKQPVATIRPGNTTSSQRRGQDAGNSWAPDGFSYTVQLVYQPERITLPFALSAVFGTIKNWPNDS